ncbi:MAG: cupredoxin domain-containing protein [Patescibacteria group bacterium]
MDKRLKLTLGLAGLVLALAGCKQATKAPDATKEAVSGTEGKTYTLQEQNDSGLSGTVKLREEAGKTIVTFAVTGGASGVAQPAHIHEGTCANLGGVVYPLTNVVNGASVTSLDVALDALLLQGPRAVNIHKSQSEVSVYVACVDINGGEMTDDNDSDEAQEQDNAPSYDSSSDDAEDAEDADSATQGSSNSGQGSTGQGTTSQQTVKTYIVAARNFSYSIDEIKVKKDDIVKIDFRSVDGFHDWVVDEFDARTARVNTGGTSSIQFKADKTGTFEFYCSVGQHRQMGMVGRLIVE